MAKGQKRSNKEVRKLKVAKPKRTAANASLKGKPVEMTTSKS